jgi:amino acid adenylation domain-containing protein
MQSFPADMGLGPVKSTCRRECALKTETHLACEPRAVAPTARPQWISVPQLVAHQAAANPDALAVVSAGERLTYADLDRRANQLAHYLKAIGAGPEAVVGLHLARSVASVIGSLAVLKAGGAYLPLDPSLPAERLRFMLSDANVPVVLSQGANAERLPKHTWSVLDWEDLHPLLARYPTESPAASVTAENLAYVIYTSGSTGQPKGVEATQGGLRNLIDWHIRAFSVDKADRASLQAVVGFDASVWELWPYLAAGASVHIPEESIRSNPEAMRQWLLAEKISITFLPTAVAEQMLLLEWPSNAALRVLLTGADTLRRRPATGLPFVLVNNYGPTEGTVVATSGRVSSDDADARTPSIGHAIDNTQIYILDEKMHRAAAGEAGEIYIGGAGVARGYRNNPILTAEKFVRNPFGGGFDRLYRTGDRGRFLASGEIEFMGRLDDQIKIRGYRVEPNEIIQAINSYPGVQASAITVDADQTGAKRLLAYVVPAPGAAVDPTGLRQMLSRQLPDYMVPAVLVRVETLPLTVNGKVDLSALPAPTAANILADDKFVAPRTTVEQRMAAILRPLLHVDRVSVKDNFFLLGGHSLLGTQLITKISESFGVELSLFSLFDHPTLEEMSLEVEKLILAKVEAMSAEDRRALSQFAFEEKR